ncbi:MAG: hypothetical protein P8Y69_17540, partial [Gammaproteobacteria bacterium]
SIKAANLVVFFITPRAVLSDHCLREIDLAVDLQKPILAVYLEPTELPSGTDLTLSRIQGILRYELTAATYQQALVAGIGEHLERGVARVATAPAGPRKRRTAGLYLGAAALVLAGLAASYFLPNAPPSTPPAESRAATKFVISVPNFYLPPYAQPDITVSPDGGTVVYNSGGMLNLRRMDDFDAAPLPATQDAHGPFFSPDAPRAGANFSGHWGTDDSIVYAPVGNVGISRAAAAGGEPELITSLDEASAESTHLWPQLLPGNQRVMYTALGSSAGWEEAAIVVKDLRSGERKTLVTHASCASYVAPDRLLYVNGNGNLMVAPFDVERLALSGPAVPIQSGILRSVWGAGASYAASPTTLAFVQGDAFSWMRIELR